MRILICALALLVVNCRDQQPPAPTPEQAEQLNEAEAMLNDLAENEEGPEGDVPSSNH